MTCNEVSTPLGAAEKCDSHCSQRAQAGSHLHRASDDLNCGCGTVKQYCWGPATGSLNSRISPDLRSFSKSQRILSLLLFHFLDSEARTNASGCCKIPGSIRQRDSGSQEEQVR
jgi:hypothetical protein